MSTEPNKKQSSKHANGGTFRKGDGRKAERSRRGTPNKMSRECKDMINDCFHQVGGLQGLKAWVEKSDENRGAFYTKMYIRLLPVKVAFKGHKNAVYETLADVRAAYAVRGVALESIEKLKRLEQAKQIETHAVDVNGSSRSD